MKPLCGDFMPTLQEMYQRTCFTPEYDRMIRSVQPMCDYFGVNSFYYARIVSIRGVEYYTDVGTHLPWQEFFFDNIDKEISFWPSMRHPEKLKTGHMFFKHFSDPLFDETLKSTWDKFNTNILFNTMRRIPEGIEQFGFGLKSIHPKAEYNFMKGLPLLFKFIDFFCQKNKKFIQLACENQAEISTFIGPAYYQGTQSALISKETNELLQQLGLGGALSLTMREREMLQYLAHGYPASYISEKLNISTRTVEKRIADIKLKLQCDSKPELITMTNAINSII